MKFSDLGGILTHDLQNRNLTLYTAKLRDHNKKFGYAELKVQGASAVSRFKFDFVELKVQGAKVRNIWKMKINSSKKTLCKLVCLKKKGLYL